MYSVASVIDRVDTIDIIDIIDVASIDNREWFSVIPWLGERREKRRREKRERGRGRESALLPLDTAQRLLSQGICPDFCGWERERALLTTKPKSALKDCHPDSQHRERGPLLACLHRDSHRTFLSDTHYLGRELFHICYWFYISSQEPSAHFSRHPDQQSRPELGTILIPASNLSHIQKPN